MKGAKKLVYERLGKLSKLITITITLSISSESVFSQEVVFYEYNGKVHNEKIVINGCKIKGYNKGESGFSVSTAHLGVLTCKADTGSGIINGFTGVSCSSDGNQVTWLYKDDEELIDFIDFGYDEIKGRAFTPAQGEKLANQLNQRAVKCKSESHSTKENYPTGTVVNISNVWEGGYGYTGRIVAIKEPNKTYDVMITSIHQGSAMGLNPHYCSNEIYLEKYRDEGRVVTIPSYCWTKKKGL